MNRQAAKRTDLPTVVLHWGMVLSLLVSVTTGWRIASLGPTSTLMRWADALMVQGAVHRWHFVSATLLTACVLAYLALLWRTGLFGRLAVRVASLSSPDAATRWQAINKLIYWVAFALLAVAAVTGGLMYFAPGAVPTANLAPVHQFVSWAFVVYIVLHVAAQLMLGGVRQLLKIVSPRMAYGAAGVVALTAGAASAAAVYLADRSAASPLVITAIEAAAAPQLDGNDSDGVWQQAPQAVVHTAQGWGLVGGEVDVQVRALHDGQRAYFLFRWPDATYSQKHIPLVKAAGGWKLQHSNYYNNDENDYYEDKFAVMLARSSSAGGDAVQVGPQPLADKPGPSNKMGLHVTSDGSLADVWHWKSVRSGSIQQFDDNYFGAPMAVKPGRYTGGYTQDPKTAGGFDQNFDKIKDSEFVKLKFLPKDLAAQQVRQGRFNPDVNVSDEGVFAMPASETVPYSAEADAAIPVGTVLPSVVYNKPFEGDRGDVSAHAVWKNGWWTIEASRVLDTGSKFDQPLVDGMFMWVSVFDHSQARHTRHMVPLRVTLAAAATR